MYLNYKKKMFSHTDPLIKNLHILKAEDIFKMQQFKLYYKYLKHTLSTFWISGLEQVNIIIVQDIKIYINVVYNMNLLDSAYYIIYPMQSITAQQI